jgi:hypothetical protein
MAETSVASTETSFPPGVGLVLTRVWYVPAPTKLAGLTKPPSVTEKLTVPVVRTHFTVDLYRRKKSPTLFCKTSNSGRE